MSRRLAFALALVILAPTAAFAQLDCVVPTQERTSGSGLSLRSPALASIRQAALAVEAIVKQNATLMAGARPVRVRTQIDYSHDQPWTAKVFTGIYNEEAWVGPCDLSPYADRGGGLRDGTLLVTVNEPRAALGYPSGGDAELEAFEAPQLVGHVAGFPIYKDATGTTVMLSRTKAAPWVPVTIAEALVVEARRLDEKYRERLREKARPRITETKVRRCYDTMKTVDASRAEEACGPVRRALQDEQAQRTKQESDTDAMFATQREDLKRYRESFSPQHLQGPASPDGRRPSGVTRVDAPTGRPLVKVDPAYARLDPARVHVIYVSRAIGPASDPVAGRHQWMERSAAALDYAALATLMNVNFGLADVKEGRTKPAR